jgi:hypothetical protein
VSLISSALLAVGAAAAAPPDDPIVVTGTQALPMIRQAIRQVTAAPVDDQLARWRAPVCVGVVGVSKSIGVRVIGRIETAARGAEIALARHPCKANAFVTFTSDGAALAKLLEKKSSRTFAAMALSESKTLLESDLPVRWWYGYESTGADGRPVVDSAAAIGANASRTGGINLPARITSSYGETLVGTKFSVNVVSATVIVDVTLANGRSLDAVADYAGRVILGPTRLPVRAADQSTILTLFSGATSSPDQLTRFDRAYLWALYKLPAERAAWTQRGKFAALVADRMNQD